MSSLVDSFSEVTDPRVNRQRRHRLIDIIVIAVLAVMCNADTWKDINIWGVANRQWLETFLELQNGIPSRDTFRRTISRVAPDQFQQAVSGGEEWYQYGGASVPGPPPVDRGSVSVHMTWRILFL